jgi:hypothetical protein
MRWKQMRLVNPQQTEVLQRLDQQLLFKQF